MKFSYFDMLSGSPIPVSGVGTLKSPVLRDLCPSTGIGYEMYNVYLNFLSWDKDKIIQYDRILGLRGADKLAQSDQLSAYDTITLLIPTREFCREVLSFFMIETLEWDEKTRAFVSFDTTEDEKSVVGTINRNNFEEVRAMMLQLNFIGLDQSDEREISYASDHSKELWEKAQNFLKKQSAKQESEDRPEYHIGNIISKLCSAHPSYNLLNVWKLTVFQLYDAFFQYGYIRSSDLSEAIFSNHGGDKFKFEDWIKPILENTK